MYMGYFSSVHDPIQVVAFDTDGSSWFLTGLTVGVAIADVYYNIAARLNSKVVSYAKP
jgi:hypothetical protein